MPMPVNSCPKCGAMIVPQLSRCRQCKAYLHGTGLEGFAIEKLLPAQLQRAPATATLILFICLFYALMLALAGEDALTGFSGFSLQQLGATHGVSIMLGEYWRFVTSIFGHHNPLHLIMNLGSLVFVGELVERILDRKKMLLIYLASGVASMAISHLWYVQFKHQPDYVSAGASGAVCGMIGAAWFAARKLGPREAEVVRSMKRWSVLMVVWGLAVPGINNAAHFGGFLVGALLAHLTPVGIAQSVRTQRILSVVSIAAIAGVLGCCALMIEHLRGFPAALEDDVYAGKEWDHSSQKIDLEACADAATAEKPAFEDAIHKCELARRALPTEALPYQILVRLYEAQGDHEHAALYKRIGDRVAPFRWDG